MRRCFVIDSYSQNDLTQTDEFLLLMLNLFVADLANIHYLLETLNQNFIEIFEDERIRRLRLESHDFLKNMSLIVCEIEKGLKFEEFRYLSFAKDNRFSFTPDQVEDFQVRLREINMEDLGLFFVLENNIKKAKNKNLLMEL